MNISYKAIYRQFIYNEMVNDNLLYTSESMKT